jgi:hypothetical protein
MVFTPDAPTQPSRLVADPELSPLDLAIAPNGNIVVSSERPFGAVDAVTSVREYDATDGHLVRFFSSNGKAEFRKPRGLRFALNEVLHCVARDEVVGFDFASGECPGAIAQLPRLNGQALVLFREIANISRFLISNNERGQERLLTRHTSLFSGADQRVRKAYPTVPKKLCCAALRTRRLRQRRA